MPITDKLKIFRRSPEKTVSHSDFTTTHTFYRDKTGAIFLGHKRRKKGIFKLICVSENLGDSHFGDYLEVKSLVDFHKLEKGFYIEFTVE